MFTTKNTKIERNSISALFTHKYFNCNFGDIIIPIDKWFGTFNDGSAEIKNK